MEIVAQEPLKKVKACIQCMYTCTNSVNYDIMYNAGTMHVHVLASCVHSTAIYKIYTLLIEAKADNQRGVFL